MSSINSNFFLYDKNFSRIKGHWSEDLTFSSLLFPDKIVIFPSSNILGKKIFEGYLRWQNVLYPISIQNIRKEFFFVFQAEEKSFMFVNESWLQEVVTRELISLENFDSLIEKFFVHQNKIHPYTPGTVTNSELKYLGAVEVTSPSLKEKHLFQDSEGKFHLAHKKDYSYQFQDQIYKADGKTYRKFTMKEFDNIYGRTAIFFILGLVCFFIILIMIISGYVYYIYRIQDKLIRERGELPSNVYSGLKS